MKWTRGETHTNANEIRHVWLQVIEGAVVLRFEFVHLLEDRAFELPPSMIINRRATEGTCRSWVIHKGPVVKEIRQEVSACAMEVEES